MSRKQLQGAGADDPKSQSRHLVTGLWKTVSPVALGHLGRVGTSTALLLNCPPIQLPSIEKGLTGEEDMWPGCQRTPRLSLALKLLFFLNMVSPLSFGLWGFWRPGSIVRCGDSGSWEPHWTLDLQERPDC